MVWYNKEIFEENGLKTPKEYYTEGNWTWDTYRELALANTVDSNSDGKPEIWGCAIDMPSMFVFTTGHDIVTLANGKIVNDVRNADVARAVQFYTDLYIKDKCAYDGTDSRDMFAAGQIAMLTGGMWYRSSWVDMLKRNAIDYAPFPKDPQADKYYLMEEFGNYYIGNTAKNPEGAAAYLTSERYHTLDKTGREEGILKDFDTTGWTLELDDWLWNEFYKDDKKGVLSTYIMFEINNFWGDIWFRPKNGEPWSAVSEEISPKIDDTIARILEG